MSDLLLAGRKTQARLCQNLQDPPLGRTAWNRLLAKSETRSVFLTWQWLATWWECFREGAELFTFVVEREGELIGIAPLQLRRQDGSRDVEFLGMGSSDYCDVIASEDDKPEVVQAVLEAVLKRSDRWDRIRLRYLPAHSKTVRVLESLDLPDGLELQSAVEFNCPALSIETSPSFAEACTRKKSLVRHTRYFERLAPLEFHHAMDKDEILDRLPDFFEQHRDRRFMAGGRSLFDHPSHRRFYERIVPALLDSNHLRFSVLRWRGEVLAYHFGFRYDDVLTWYKPTFNVDYARYSPGEVLLLKLLQDSIRTGVREFDFTVGDESFKERFANVKRQNLCIEIQPKQRRRLGQAIQSDVKRHVKGRHPRLFAKLKGMLSDDPEVRGPRESKPVTARFGVVSHILWRAGALQPEPSEFGAQWARYSDIKALVRREGLKPGFLLECLAKMRNGEKAVVALWHERPVALLWVARDPKALAQEVGLEHEFPDGALMLTDSYMASDLRGSPRRETLPPALLTFLAAEGASALYGVQDTRKPTPPLGVCGAPLVPVVRRIEIIVLGWRVALHHKWDDVETTQDP